MEFSLESESVIDVDESMITIQLPPRFLFAKSRYGGRGGGGRISLNGDLLYLSRWREPE